MENAYYTFTELINTLHISRTLGYKLLAEGEITGAKKIGKRKWIIPKSAIEKLFDTD